MYTKEQVVNKSLEYFKGDELAAKVFVDKYALQDKEGNYYELTPDDMHHRIAKEFARIEQKYPNPISEEEIYNHLKGFKYIVPQGSPMSAIGNPFYIQSISNCFVVPEVYDSYGGICKSDEQIAQISKRRGGIGVDISSIRPKGLFTTNAAKSTDGIGIFMERFSNTIREVGQNGRRGALMITCSIHHPEIETFIKIKQDKRKVTGANISVKCTDEFMNAVKNDTEYEQRFPIDSKNPIIVKKVRAKEIWEQIIKCAHDSAEPGVLFWDTIINNSPADSYSDVGYKTISTNPCLTGDTLVAVADGRKSVSIKELADSGDDVDVFTLNSKGNVVVKKMRHPRITGYMQDVYKVNIEGGHSFKATANHKIPLLNGMIKQVSELVNGDQLQMAYNVIAKFNDVIPSLSKTKSQDYSWWKSSKNSWNQEHRIVYECYNGKINKNFVIHHKDYNALNNNIDNLQHISKKDHDALHAQDMIGDKNPMRRAVTEWSEEKWTQYSENMSKATSGYLNGNACDISNEELFNKAVEFSKNTNERFSNKSWAKFAKENNLPASLVEFRFSPYSSFDEWSKAVAVSAGINENLILVDPRIQRTYNKAIKQGYQVKIENNEVFVLKKCEQCGSDFYTSYFRREISFCQQSCAALHLNSDKKIAEKRTNTLQATYSNKMEQNKKKQLDVYTQLRLELGRNPLMKEWEQSCKNNNVTYRVKTKFGFKSYKELQEAAETYNHRVVSVEYVGKEDVYNGTVDDTHTMLIGRWNEYIESINKYATMYANVAQCGEIPLSAQDSCRLMTLNLYSYVDNPFTKNSKFNYELFYNHVQICQRMMDNLIDLELEAIDKIINKIESDPEPLDIKQTELQLWQNIKIACYNGRRTGTGIVGLGDTLAALNIIYGSETSILETEKIYKTLALGSYRSSVNLAKERGSFPVFSFEKEKDNKFLNKIWNEDKNLYDDYLKYGRRNIACNTTAPTGSQATQTQTTSGIEPTFMISYKRRKKINQSDDKISKVDFVDELGDKWQEFIVYHHHYKTWMDVTGKSNVEESPYYKATSNDVDWKSSVSLQAAAQKWVDHSISKTCNLPSNTSVELVSDVYMKAWESGCKGFTIYRDGSRDGVLVSTETTSSNNNSKYRPDNIQVAYAPKRPKELPCDIHHVTYKGQKWVAIIGLLNGKPYELFTGHSEMLSLPSTLKFGKIIKNKSKYNLSINTNGEELILKDIVNIFNNDMFAWSTRLISTSLRHGVDCQFIVDQLNKEGNITDINKVLSRVIKNYIVDGTKVLAAKCEKCGSTELVYQEKCPKCMSCGFTKCG